MEWKGRFGVPYQGSKNAIAREIVSVLPCGKRFVDLFAGGCAITHAAMVSGKYSRFHANDVGGIGVRLFVDSIHGKSNDKWKVWVGREEFNEKRLSDPLISLCWSFGNNQVDYMYSKKDEQAKSRLCEEYIRSDCKLDLKGERLQHIERIRQLAELGKLKEVSGGMSVSFKDYADVELEVGDVIYCDPPYRNSRCDGYTGKRHERNLFDTDRFWKWAYGLDIPVFVSEYTAPSNFIPIWRKDKIKLTNAFHGREIACECLYVADKFSEMYNTELMLWK